MAGIDSARRDALPAGTSRHKVIVESLVGHGGFGIVYRASHDEFGAIFAVKEYLPIELAVREGPTVWIRSATEMPFYQDGPSRFRDKARALMPIQGDHVAFRRIGLDPRRIRRSRPGVVRKAQRRGMPAFMIHANLALDALVEAKPTNEAQLLGVPAVGAVLAKKYGGKLIQIIRGAGSCVGSGTRNRSPPQSSRRRSACRNASSGIQSDGG